MIDLVVVLTFVLLGSVLTAVLAGRLLHRLDDDETS